MTTPISFHREFDFTYGQLEQLSPLVRRVVARNPGPFTYKGTGTYVVGHGSVAVIDPGPDDSAHLEAILEGLGGESVTHILITHTHIDHSPLSRALSDATGARVYAFGPNPSTPGGTGEAGGDVDFVPDEIVCDGDRLEGKGWSFDVVHTPGHASNHLCFGLTEEKLLFTGDHVMGWSTSVISPPDGDMAAYVESLKRLLVREDLHYLPTHGPRIDHPQDYVRQLILHRSERESEILAALTAGPVSIGELVDRIYVGLPDKLVRAAGRSVRAHLIDLERRGAVFQHEDMYRRA